MGASSRAYGTGQDEGELGIDALRFVAGAVTGGVVGTTVMTAVLAVVNVLYGPNLDVFRTVAEFAGTTGTVALGVGVFFAAGSLAWPLVFASLAPYMPGGTLVRQGVVFAAVLWVGFVVAFGQAYAGVDLAVFLAFSVVTHLAYGAILGAVAGRVTGYGSVAEVAV
jgi:cytochrome c oxidase subunit 1